MSSRMVRSAVNIAAGLTVIAATLWFAPPLFPDTRIDATVAIARPPEEVFAYITTPAHWPEWQASSLGTQGAADHPLTLGEGVTEDVLVDGKPGAIAWTVVARDAPRRWVIRGQPAGRSTVTTVTYRVSRDGSGTRFERELLYRPRNLLCSIEDGFGRRRRNVRDSMESLVRLKGRLER